VIRAFTVFVEPVSEDEYSIEIYLNPGMDKEDVRLLCENILANLDGHPVYVVKNEE
jgi:hypothetical protein